jgi:hypothetical protein
MKKQTKAKTKKAKSGVSRKKHTILVAVHVETRRMTEGEAQALVRDIEYACEHTLRAKVVVVDPEHTVPPLTGKCVSVSVKAQMAAKDGKLAIVATESLSELARIQRDIDCSLEHVGQSLLQLPVVSLCEVSDEVERIGYEVDDLVALMGDLEDSLSLHFDWCELT